MPIDAAKAQHILTQIPSSRADPPKQSPLMSTYFMSIQRRETAGQGRWREIASWQVTTTETDMLGPLNCGLRDNYRIIITEPSSNVNTLPSNTSPSHSKSPSDAPPSSPDNSRGENIAS